MVVSVTYNATMQATPEVLTPFRLNKLIDQSLRGNLPSVLVVRGEISNFSRNRNSGHLYFTIKDDQASVDCVMFANRAALLAREPSDGQDVLVTGNIGVYIPRGRYQLIAGAIQPVGMGNLELERRRIEARLRDEGLLEPERKRILPRYPRRIALVTSRQAAGYADIVKVLDRCPPMCVTLFDVPVQGPAAAPAITGTLRRVAREHEADAFDVLLLARGGGSLEDLWAFNDEALARVLASMPMPTVTGIGHEIDVSIADLVADHHAHTPTEAATVIASHWMRAGDLLLTIRQRLQRFLRQTISDARVKLRVFERHELMRKPQIMLNVYSQRLDELDNALRDIIVNRHHREYALLMDVSQRLVVRHPGPRLKAERVRVDAVARKFELINSFRLAALKDRLNNFEHRFRASSPRSLLARGYSITRVKSTGELLRSVDQVIGGEKLVIQLGDGKVESLALDPKQPELF